ncbi:MAG: antibiotic ABC transporter ATP-binding protein [Acidobacteria bacterium RIFCSPLOWO2_02_FULL_67_36]|nr:MAG: antibiotic ABC transporter ATP-binding protein [Acidobacteria bacterium RIFCSPLOWO2_02_FULL_67_36]OFW23479.1 MAG: antibiotic ABC transporter ATP-binding protein [Acidobacteria bacterium RIFCSPLOWO2_12_FULL_66_21]
MSIHDEEILGKAYDARLMRRLLTYLRPYTRHVALALAAIISASVLQLSQPYLMKLAIDRYIATGDLHGLNRIAMAFVAILFAAFALDYIQTWTLQMTGQRIMFDLRMQVYGHLQRLDLQFYDRNPVGRLMTRVTTDVDVLNDMFTSGVVSIFGDVFTLLGIMIVLITMDWRLALVAFSVLPLIVIVTQWFRRNVRESYRTVRTWIARINAFLQEHITGMPTVQLFRRERRAYERFDGINRAHRDANVDSIFYYAVFYPLVEVVGALASALIIWYGGGWTLQGTIAIGSLVAFLLYSQRFFRPISDMSEKFNVLQAAMASSERIFKLLDTPVQITSGLGARGSGLGSQERPMLRATHAPSARPDAGEGHIAFEQVSFAYNPGEYVLRDVSFEVRPGERLGIVGATGAGKSTLINLLLRFYDVTEGRILIDGRDVRDMELAEVRRLFSLVLQDVHLFSGTIADNIRLGERSIDDERVRRAAQAVHADRFVQALPLGYASPVAERGATLSVGQKQLLSFARALAFNPRVLVLDEATSSVDTETELLIRDALHVLMAGRTTIAIAHRLSTIQDMDKILVLHKGQLRESGRHQDLLAQRGIYYKLYQLQYRDQDVG